MRSRCCHLCGLICQDQSPSSCSKLTRAIQVPPSFTRAQWSTPRCVGSARAPVGLCSHRSRPSRRGARRRILLQTSPPAWHRRTGTWRCGAATRRSLAFGVRTSTRRKPARSSSRSAGQLGRVGRDAAGSFCKATLRPRCVLFARGVLRGRVCGASAKRSPPSHWRMASRRSSGGSPPTATWQTNLRADSQRPVRASWTSCPKRRRGDQLACSASTARRDTQERGL